MRTSLALNNVLYSKYDMLETHPIKIGFSDKKAELILDRILFVIITLMFLGFFYLIIGVYYLLILMILFGLSLVFYIKKLAKSEINDNNSLYYKFSENEIVEDLDLNITEEIDDQNKMTSPYDLTTKYNLVSL